MTKKIRCNWAGNDPIMIAYHDKEWGVPVHDDRLLFEFLLLEGAQAGLSWSTILRKRENYRAAFDNFDPKMIASYGEDKIRQLLENPGIVRNRAKLVSAATNARAVLATQKEFGSFDNYIWKFVGNEPIHNGWTNASDLPDKTPEADAMSKDLKERGFKFVGPTICYAFMQATGMINDHMRDCFRYYELCGSHCVVKPHGLTPSQL